MYMWTARLIPRITTYKGCGTVLVWDTRQEHPNWKFPGGRKTRRDRTWRDTVVRELFQETGMIVPVEAVSYGSEYIGSHGWPVLLGAADLDERELAWIGQERNDPELPRFFLNEELPGLNLPEPVREILSSTNLIPGVDWNAARAM